MSRLTGSDALGLYEAYQAVYNPQELTEEQVWEEVETWVNSLIEEGYDLSDYTWEEMYEEYLNEAPKKYTLLDLIGKGAEKAGQSLSRGVQGWQKSAQVSYGGGLSNKSKEEPPTKPTRPTGMSDIRGSDKPGSNTPAIPKTNTPTATKTAAPAPAAARPAAPAPAAARPAAPAPAARPSGGTPASPTTPTPSAPRQKDTSITDMIGRSQVRQGAAVNTGNASSDTRAIAARSSVGATPKPAASAPARPMGGARGRLMSSFDPFDVIKGHLLDEGYADTEEAALAIMTNMSEEWRQNILSEDPVQDYRDMKRAQENSSGMRGPELSHSSKGPKSPGSATQKPQPRSREFEKVLSGTSKPRGREFTNPPS